MHGKVVQQYLYEEDCRKLYFKKTVEYLCVKIVEHVPDAIKNIGKYFIWQ
jgi:hypothetical protein